MMTSFPRPLALLLVTLAGLVLVFSLPAIPQPVSFHDFADKRTIFGVPNMLNVLSNLAFLYVGGFGLMRLKRDDSIIYFVLFGGIVLTGLGSAYYHLAPGNDRLVWDRAPMAIVFMSFLSAVISAVISKRAGDLLLWPLVLLGLGSALWWYYTEGYGFGDLRLFFFVQFCPMVIIPLMLFLYRRHVPGRLIKCLAAVILWYVAAKLLEQWDRQVYVFLPVSGHTLKHLAAAVACWYISLIRPLRV